MAQITYIAPPIMAQMDGKPIECVARGCDYQREPYAGCIIEYTCPRCGDSYERDVS
jgi:hypothetical protein